jgi:hypothetical protein
MRYALVGILVCVVFYVATVAAAILIGPHPYLTVPLSGLIGSVAGTTVLMIGLRGRLPGDSPLRRRKR